MTFTTGCIPRVCSPSKPKMKLLRWMREGSIQTGLSSQRYPERDINRQPMAPKISRLANRVRKKFQSGSTRLISKAMSSLVAQLKTLSIFVQSKNSLSSRWFRLAKTRIATWRIKFLMWKSRRRERMQWMLHLYKPFLKTNSKRLRERGLPFSRTRAQILHLRTKTWSLLSQRRVDKSCSIWTSISAEASQPS